LTKIERINYTSKDLIKLLTGLINLFKDLIKQKISLKVYWAKIGRIN